MELTKIAVFQYLGSDEEFPIDFDNAWEWVGYTRKENALNKLRGSFELSYDYIYAGNVADQKIFSPFGENNKKGRRSDKYYMSIDCFKSFCMMANTSKGKEVRRYFLDCEKELKRRIFEEESKRSRRFILDMYVGNPQEWSKQFKLSFYENICKLRGWNFTKHRYPPIMGQYTIDIVYRRIQPGLWEELKIKNPDKYKYRYHQLLTEKIGSPHLRRYLINIINLMESCTNWNSFMVQLDRQYPMTGAVQLDLFFDVMAENDPEEFQKWIDF